MSELTTKRTLVKSPPELWAEVSDLEALAKHLGEFGDIKITRLEPETTVAWEGDRVSGTVQLEPSGWGTKVTLSVDEPEPIAVVEPEPEPEPEPAAASLNASGAVCPVVGTPDAPFSRPGSVKVSWSVTGAKGASLSIDGGLFSSDLPASGSQTLPFACEKTGTNTHTYTVTPVGPKGSSKSTKASARSDQ
jgi:hypothetical protein